MKKFVIALVACLALGASAFAKSSDGFSVGYTYGIFTYQNNGNKYSQAGSGIYLDNFTSLNKFFGMGFHAYLDFPECEKKNGNKNSSSSAHFFTLGCTLMPALNLPIGDFLDIRVGAGIGFMIVNENYRLAGEKINFNYYMLTIPVGVAAQFKFGSFFGLKVGCDVQFEIKGWYHETLLDTEGDFNKKGLFVNPYVAFTILY
ncbi:MAG: outer membrane beta-barrel protein [Treponema sp.]|nr:outer membrane beta-barrel protein [Candidatus Treponema scatequi]